VESASGASGKLGVALFAALLVIAVAAFAVTRAVRSEDDLVNTVELTKRLKPGGSARVSFALAQPDDDVDVLIIDGSPGGDDAQVRALARGEDLAAGTHAYRWDGRDDAGRPVPPGLYALEVVLGEEDRDILPPGRIRVARKG
jgi:flagellar hook assembly protein FlgD